jgi:MFS family permease
MLNWADLTGLLITLTGAIGAALGAAAEKAAWWVVILFALGGLLVGFVVGRLSSRLAYWILKQESKHAGLGIVYMIIPMPFLLGVILGTVWLAAWLARNV